MAGRLSRGGGVMEGRGFGGFPQGWDNSLRANCPHPPQARRRFFYFLKNISSSRLWGLWKGREASFPRRVGRRSGETSLVSRLPCQRFSTRRQPPQPWFDGSFLRTTYRYERPLLRTPYRRTI